MAGEKEEDVDTLKRRGRRRLVGAVALVLLAVVVLPMVFDSEPRRSAPAVSVRVPGEEESPFAPKVAPKAPEVTPKAPEPKAEEQKPVEEKKPPVEQPKAAEPAKPAAKKEDSAKQEVAKVERARAEAALSGTAPEYIVPVGAFSNPAPVIAKLSRAKVKYYTEKIATAKGHVTRVRAGPFATKAEAERAAESLKGLGLKPGGVTTRS